MGVGRDAWRDVGIGGWVVWVDGDRGREAEMD